MFFNGLMGAMGAIGLSLSTDKSYYQVGETPVYILQGGIPGSSIYWESFKNGKATGEFNAPYGDVIGPNGTVELPASQAFTDQDEGNWQKIALVVAPDGAQTRVQTSFRVGPKVTAPAPTQPGTTSGSFLEGSYNIVGFEIPKPLALVGGGLGVWWLLGQFGGRRR
jgi:hypothetical protein